MLKSFAIGLMLLCSTPATAQPVCRPLPDVDAQHIITEPGESLVKDSATECKMGDAMVQTRFRVIDKRGATYDCEIRAQGAKRYCWYGG